MLPYIELFGKQIGTYALCSVIGLLLCGFVAYILCRNKKIYIEDIILLMVSLLVGLFVGGHILYAVTHISEIIELFKQFGDLSFIEITSALSQYIGGMVYYGGFIGACIAIYIHTKCSKAIDSPLAFDVFAVTAPLFHTFGRIGCFLGGCCYGIECSWGITVHNNPIIPELNGTTRMPIQLIEAFLNLCIFIFILVLFKRNKSCGKLIYYYMLIYPVVRFIDEFFRGDGIRGFLFGLSTSQWVSILLFVFAVFKLITLRKKTPQTEVEG